MELMGIIKIKTVSSTSQKRQNINKLPFGTQRLSTYRQQSAVSNTHLSNKGVELNTRVYHHSPETFFNIHSFPIIN